MKKAVLFSAMGALASMAGVANAQEVGRVISATPVIQQVAIPRQVCNVQQVSAQPSGGGAVLGAIVGGIIGNQIGHGSGRAAATMLGTFGGAAIGNNAEAQNSQAMQQCTTQMTYENRTVAYNVVYEFSGRQYNVQMPHDPGPTIQLRVTPVGSNPPPQTAIQAEDGTTLTPQAVYVSPAAVPTVIYPAYHRPYYYPYYAPIGISLGFGFYGGHRHHHRWR